MAIRMIKRDGPNGKEFVIQKRCFLFWWSDVYVGRNGPKMFELFMKEKQNDFH
jgi:hypothetical protein